MIFGWIIGLVLSLLMLILIPDDSMKGWAILGVIYFTIGLSVDCYKLQNKLPSANYDKKLAELAKACANDNLDIRKELLLHIKYMQDINEMSGGIIKEQELIKKSILEFTDFIENLTKEQNDSNSTDTVDKNNLKDT